MLLVYSMSVLLLNHTCFVHLPSSYKRETGHTREWNNSDLSFSLPQYTFPFPFFPKVFHIANQFTFCKFCKSVLFQYLQQKQTFFLLLLKFLKHWGKKKKEFNLLKVEFKIFSSVFKVNCLASRYENLMLLIHCFATTPVLGR